MFSIKHIKNLKAEFRHLHNRCQNSASDVITFHFTIPTTPWQLLKRHDRRLYQQAL